MASDTFRPGHRLAPGALTFGQARLDRAAHLREAPEAIARLWRDPSARVLPLWRQKPSVTATTPPRLGWLPVDAPGLATAAEAPLFLGCAPDRGAPRFAVEIPDWTTDPVDPALADGYADRSAQQHPEFPDDHRFVDLRTCMATLDAEEAEAAATARALLGWHATHGYCARCGVQSTVAAAGWQRVCPACGGRHFPRTDPVVIMLVTHGERALVARAPAWPEGMFSLLAGYVEPGEPIEDAVRREVREEAGINVGAVRYLASQPWPFPASLMIACHGVALDTTLTLDPVEIAQARWVGREEMLAAYAGRHPTMSAARPGAVARHVIGHWLAGTLPGPDL